MSRPKKTESQLNTIREQILETAYAILLEDGPEAISSRAIAKRMGVAHMTLFTYFENQSAITNALRERELAKFNELWWQFEQRAQHEAVTEVVKDALMLIIQYERTHPKLFWLAWAMPEAIGESNEQAISRRQERVKVFARVLKLGMERDVFELRPPLLASATVLGMITAPYILFYTGKLSNITIRDQMVNEMMVAALLYLKKQKDIAL